MSRQNPGRHGSAYWNARKKVLRYATSCAICGGDLVPDAPPRSKWSTSCDHIIPLSDLEHYDAAERYRLSVDPENMRAVHLTCNSKRGAHSGRAPRFQPAPAPVEPEPPYTGKWRNPSNGRPWSTDWYKDGRGLNPLWDGREP
jgi:hypothetical protein